MLRQGSKWSKVVLVIVLLISFLLLGGGIAIYANSLTSWWIPVIPAATVALGTAPMLSRKWERLTDIGNGIVNSLCHIFVTGSLTYFAFLGVNYWGADRDSDVAERTEIVKKYRKSHTRYRRVSRRHHVPDGEYYTYHLLLRFDDGRDKEMEVPFDSYRKASVGGHRTLHVQDGLLGISVIKR